MRFLPCRKASVRLSQGLAFVLVIIIGASTFCGNRETLPTLFQREWASEICHEHAGQSSNKDARSNEPWVFAGLMTLFSLVSSLVHLAPAPSRALSASWEQPPGSAMDAYHAGVNW
jgi:hypothetical protein